MTKTKTNKFLEIAESHRLNKKTEKFSGTFEEYLQLLEKDKSLPMLAHKRLYKTILDKGVTRMSDEDSRCHNLFNGEPLRTYDYFQDRFWYGTPISQKVIRYCILRL